MRISMLVPRRIVAVAVVTIALVSPGAAADAPRIASLLSARLIDDDGRGAIGGVAIDTALLIRIYRPRGFAPLWVGTDGASADAATILDRLKRAGEDGLDPADYGVAAIAPRLHAKPASQLAELEMLLTQGLARFGADLRVGRVPPEAVAPGRVVSSRPRDEPNIITGAIAAPDLDRYIESLPPATPRYRRLKRALRHYRGIAAKGGWPLVPDGRTLKPGMRDGRVKSLRERLAATGDFAGLPADPELYDDALTKAVRRFQRRHGLDEDGAVGRRTRRALNIPVTRRVVEIGLNLERRRWLAADLGPRHVFANIADATVKLVDDDRTVIDMRAVVGTTFHMTPVFSHKITYLQLNPFWNVPSSIARRELVPNAIKDPSYLGSRGFSVLARSGRKWVEVDPNTIDWSTIDPRSFAYRLRQGPGSRNALGRVKFMFPNRHNVYLHDTPARALFGKSARAFSHGCIRLGKPIQLATLLLADDPRWTRQRIDQVIESRKATTVRLKVPLPVHISYVTAWVNKDGSVHFRRDIYGRDEKLAGALRKNAARRLKIASPRTRDRR